MTIATVTIDVELNEDERDKIVSDALVEDYFRHCEFIKNTLSERDFSQIDLLDLKYTIEIREATKTLLKYYLSSNSAEAIIQQADSILDDLQPWQKIGFTL